MKKRFFGLFILIILILNGCANESVDWGKAGMYFPSPSLLTNGIVNKYYEHHDFTDGSSSFILVKYLKYAINDNGQLVETEFNVGFEPVSETVFDFDSSRQLINSELRFSSRDTLVSEVLIPTIVDWNDQKSVFKLKRSFPNGQSSILEGILLEAESGVIEDKKTKTFEYQLIFSDENGEQTAEYESEITYREGIGRFSELLLVPNRTIKTELIEQMKVEEFEKRSNHGIKRVGYIDPAKILDKEPFALCNPLSELKDYYNSTPDGRYSKNKSGLIRDLRVAIDTTLIGEQEGYLTFRYYVNCHGEAGSFVAEGVGFDYKPKAFSDDLVSNIHKAFISLDSFRPVHIREEDHDAHFYTSFRLKDGEITDILP